MEEPLAGGRLTAGVVRVDGTVRRPATAASAFVASLLTHLDRVGYSSSPRICGTDEIGRDVLSFVPGEVAHRWRRFSDRDVAAVATMLRGLHDASAKFVSAAREFSRELHSGYHGLDAVVCHHDPGPNNVVFANGEPSAFIDFDFAAPGHRLEDVGYLAWSWCISSKVDRGPATEQGRQLRILADAYGLDAADRRRVLPAVRARLTRNIAFWRRRMNHPWTGAGTSPDEVVIWTQREREHILVHHDELARPLEAR